MCVSLAYFADELLNMLISFVQASVVPLSYHSTCMQVFPKKTFVEKIDLDKSLNKTGYADNVYNC